MIKTMFDKILLGLLGLLFVALVGTAIYAKYYKSKAVGQATTIDNLKTELGVSVVDENLTGIAKYAEGVIDSIDKEVKRETTLVDYGEYTDTF